MEHPTNSPEQTQPKARFQIGHAVQELSAPLPYTQERWISARRYDKTQECWMYRVRNDHVREDPGTNDPGWFREHSLKRDDP